MMAVLISAGVQAQQVAWLDELDVSKCQAGWGTPHAKKSVENNPLRIAGQTYERGLGTHAESYFKIDLHGAAERFIASVGVDDEVRQGSASVEFKIYGDDKLLWESGIMKTGQPAKKVELDLKKVKTLMLMVGDGGDNINYDHADWAGAQLLVSGQTPVAVPLVVSEPYVLTPAPKPQPQINDPKVFGVRPGSPVLFTIPATGKRPIKFTVRDLPVGLKLDSSTGQITGKIGESGTYNLTVIAENDLGRDSRELKIVVGETICLTPPMGWNSWNCWGCSVDDEKVRAAADAMVQTGLINHGWTYINIDDCWHGQRDPQGNIQSNAKFPDMKALTEYVHSKGLKIGLYTDCGTKTCAGYAGSKDHELQDVMTYAEWGFDYVKIDWCNTEGMDPVAAYTKLGDSIRQAPRDIVFSICNWGVEQPWKWGTQAGGNLWRTTGDITDSWGSMAGIGFSQAPLAEYAKPGHYNDPDMLVVGKVGWGPSLRPTKLTADEQYTHISLWCLLSAPLLVGCDLAQPDEFTLNLLTNDEVLAVDQDPLANQARPVAKERDTEVWVKTMEDGSKAVGLFNRWFEKRTVTAKWTDLDVQGSQRIRDLWRQKDLGTFQDQFQAEVPAHGVVMLRMWPQNR
jgi:alpha-galactosidase